MTPSTGTLPIHAFGKLSEVVSVADSESVMATQWYPFDEARTVGSHGCEGGITVRDDEHGLGARITLERGGHAPYAITCGIYGWMFHTRYLSTEGEAATAFEQMKKELERILALIPAETDPALDLQAHAVSEQIAAFVEKFP